MPTKITSISVRDIRFPTSEGLHGFDAFHKNPDYSCPYVTIETDVPGLTGNGITFTTFHRSSRHARWSLSVAVAAGLQHHHEAGVPRRF